MGPTVLVRGGAARGAASEDKAWRNGPIGVEEGDAHRRWAESGIDEALGSMHPHEFVVRFTLSHPEMSSTIVGTSSLEHLQANMTTAGKGPLSADTLQEARRRLPRAP